MLHLYKNIWEVQEKWLKTKLLENNHNYIIYTHTQYISIFKIYIYKPYAKP